MSSAAVLALVSYIEKMVPLLNFRHIDHVEKILVRRGLRTCAQIEVVNMLTRSLGNIWLQLKYTIL